MNSSVDFSDARVVICDDSITNVMFLSKIVEAQGISRINTFTDPRKAVAHLQENKSTISLLILDIEMPHMSGFDVMREILPEGRATDLSSQHAFPILVITGLLETETRHRALQSGASDFLNKPIDQVEVGLRVRNMLRIEQAYRLQATLAQRMEKEVERRTRQLNEAIDTLVNRLALAGELRDNETGLHVARVGRYSRLLAEELGLPMDMCFMIEKAAQLHDIGKIGIPDSILHKQGLLDDAERAVMQTHTDKGVALLGEHDSLLIQIAASIAAGHHERWDGSGYPRGLTQQAIPIEACIVAVADVFDALTTFRPYKDPWPTDKVFEFFRERAATEFSPDVVMALLRRREEVLAVLESLQD